MAESSSKAPCYCTKCEGTAPPISESARRRHVKTDIEEIVARQSAGYKPTISLFLEDEADGRNAPLILINNGSSNKWTEIRFTTDVLKLKADNPGVSQKCISEILSLFKQVLDDYGIPNNVPGSYEEATCKINDMLPTSNSYHACINDCIVYHDDYENADKCPECKESRYDARGKPKKEYHHFPLLDTLRNLYGVPEIARLLQAHGATIQEESPTHIRDIQETPQWKKLYDVNGFFKGEPRCISLGYSTDGGEPFQHLGISHSVWPLTLKIFNFPPEIREKTGLHFLSGIIPGPKAPQNMNAYHQFLVNDILSLEGELVWDSFHGEFFPIKADIQAYTMDWPARCKVTNHQGALAQSACHYCHIESKNWPGYHVTTFGGSRRYLPPDHDHRRDSEMFPEKAEDHRPPPSAKTGQLEHGESMDYLNSQISQKNREGSTQNLRLFQVARKNITKATGKTGKEAFSAIPTYGIDRVIIDLMHTVKNITNNVFEILTGSKHNFSTVVVRWKKNLGASLAGYKSMPLNQPDKGGGESVRKSRPSSLPDRKWRRQTNDSCQ
ncbi:uncharacterized protein LOC118432316 [Branchiostoma floridae]|uniref:Uncharacterized protein LOC118432316 n=1 Tax=Branchiostoma floridae TaxID=7739 RepID=A0A9J7NB59_BRAFL|nr:uncharacterized protein LOC118432316 [Branchiostoma floridae]